jgi:autotransporter-associated beta strand protein
MPGIVAVNNDLAQSGTFVRVDENNEFLTAHYSAPQPIVDAGPADVYDATTTQFVGPGVSAEVYALRVHSTTITGDIGSSLKVGPDTSGERAGVILNNGSLSVGTLDFGASEGFIYTSRHTSGVPTNAGGVIESTITGTGGLTTYGAGTLVLNAANTYTGPTHIRHGTLLAKSANSSTGSGDVFVSAGGTLAVEGSVAGHVQVDDGLLSLRGGVMEGDVSISEDGALEGNGTIIGDLVVSGEVFAGETAGILSLQGDVNFNGYSVWYWRLDSLTDDHTGTAGVDWNMIQFEAAAHNTIHMGDPGGVQFSLAGDFSNFAPDGNVFWTEHHQWTIMTSTTDLFTNGNTFDVYFGFKNFEQGSFFWDDVDGGTKIKLYYAPNVIPEPTTALLVVLGIVGFLVIKRARLVK